MSDTPKQCPFRQDRLCVEEECRLWDKSANNCIFNLGVATLISLFHELTGIKRKRTRTWAKIADWGIGIAENIIEKAFEEVEKKEEEEGEKDEKKRT